MVGEQQDARVHPLALLLPIVAAPLGFAFATLLLLGVRGVEENAAFWTLVILAGFPMPMARLIALLPSGTRVVLPMVFSTAGAILASPAVVLLTLLGIIAEREPHLPHASEAAVWHLVGMAPLALALLSWDTFIAALLARRRFLASGAVLGMHLGQVAACVLCVMAAAWPGRYESRLVAVAVGSLAGMGVCAVAVATGVGIGWLLEGRFGRRRS